MDRELSLEELETEHATELPEREAMTVFNIAAIWATNTAVAVNAATILSAATAVAAQSIHVDQQNEFN